MPSGPIEFVSDRDPAARVAPTEFSGGDGLVQPSPHDMTSSEVRGMMVRANDAGIDPATGLAVPEDMNKIGGNGSGELSGLKP